MITCSTCWARAAAYSRASRSPGSSPRFRWLRDLPDLLRNGAATWFPCQQHRIAALGQALGQQPGLRDFPRPVIAFKADEITLGSRLFHVQEDKQVFRCFCNQVWLDARQLLPAAIARTARLWMPQVLAPRISVSRSPTMTAAPPSGRTLDQLRLAILGSSSPWGPATALKTPQVQRVQDHLRRVKRLGGGHRQIASLGGKGAGQLPGCRENRVLQVAPLMITVPE